MENKSNNSLYRLALLGLSGSGKTAILTALSNAHLSTAYPSASLVPATDIKVSDPKEKKRYMDGFKRLEENRQLLERNEMPYGTALQDNHYYRFVFKDQDGSMTADLIDYAGELVNPRASDHEGDNIYSKNIKLVNNLRNVLAEMDGLVILLPVVSALENERQHENIAAIKATFESILGKRSAAENQRARFAPVAVLLNKWDVFSDIAYHNPSEEQEKLQKFLASSQGSPYQDLLQTLEYGLGKENVNVFAVSALGASIERVNPENGEKTYFPKEVNPLASFQLEEGIIWLVRRHQTLTLARYQKDLAQAQSFPQFLNPLFVFNNRLFKHHAEISTYYRKDTAKAKEIAQLKQQSRGLWAASLSSLLTLSVGLYLSGEYFLTDVKFKELETAIQQPSPKASDYQNYAEWLENYKNSSIYQHRLFKVGFPIAAAESYSQQARRLEQNRLKNDRLVLAKQAWEAILAETDLLKRLERIERIEYKDNKAIISGFLIEFQDVDLYYQQALQAKTELLNQVEDNFYARTTIEDTPRKIVDLLDAYLKDYPNGRYAVEAQDRRIEALLAIENEDYQTALQGDTPEKIIENIEKFLERHAEGRLRETALAEIVKQRYAIEDRLWQPVIITSVPEDRAKAAEVYLNNYSAGRYVVQAREVLDQEKIRLEDNLFALIGKALTADDKRQAARNYLQAYPQGRHALAAQEAEKHAEAEKNFASRVGEFQAQMSRGNYTNAALELAELEKLTSLPSLNKRYEELKKDFTDNIQNAYEKGLEAELNKRNWDGATLVLEEFQRLDKNYRGNNWKDWEQRQQKAIVEREDRSLYGNLLASPTISNAQSYLTAGASKRRMYSDVSEFLNISRQLAGILDITIAWNLSFGRGNDNVVMLIRQGCGGSTLARLGPEKIVSDESRSGRFTIKAKLEDTLTLCVTVYDDTSWAGTKDLGKGEQTLGIQTLAKAAQTINFSAADGASQTFHYRIVAGIPTLPTLPAFR